MRLRKQNKLLYYTKAFLRSAFPARNYVQELERLKRKLTPEDLLKAEQRVAYYNKYDDKIQFRGTTIKDLKKPVSPKSYYFDTYEYARFFDENLPINFVFGDVREVPEFSSIVKSRPLNVENKNSVLLNLDKARHFAWTQNDKPFTQKIDRLIGRAAVHQEHRYRFYEIYFDHPLCDLGQINTEGGNQAWVKPKIAIQHHLDYKFILSLEGNDVATNLKWIMSSNSIAVMPKPKFETWFMEGKLIGGKHFIEIKADYSDLESQLNLYINHPEKCLEIISAANAFCKQFHNKDMEDYCSLRVLDGYLKKI